MTTTEQALEGARRLARRAASRRAGLDSCPYPADGTPVQRACRLAWTRIYLHMRPDEAAPVDYRDDLAALADGPDTADGGAGDSNQESPASVAAALAQGTIVPRGGSR